MGHEMAIVSVINEESRVVVCRLSSYLQHTMVSSGTTHILEKLDFLRMMGKKSQYIYHTGYDVHHFFNK